jgi:hypothetical protein
MFQNVDINLILVNLIPNMQFNFASHLTKPTLAVRIIQVFL